MVKVVVMKDRRTKAIASPTVPSKGGADEYNSKKVSALLDEWGRGDVALRSDSERSIVHLKSAVRQRRIPDTIEEQHGRAITELTGRRRGQCRR